ncbi:MAG: phosphate/phosphite/phosphonate ABC transporter substrate-binding protein [Cyanobacteria bacterium]|jgi:phosphonate transport system substrate-binding protein|nr:phosphate/phosphite/phosphonate ABC transporter substrate-binding protein [Cyanobacteria bacterium GSL.Bin21]
MMNKRNGLKHIFFGVLSALVIMACTPNGNSGDGQQPTIKFGVGPYFPTPGETRDQFNPLFEKMAAAVDAKADVTVTEDWVGISEALRSGTLDVAWLGPWGYVLAHHHSPEIRAIATVKYNGDPIYYSVLLARADAPFDTLDEAIAQSQTGETLKLSLADVGSTSGWLVPTAEFERRGVNHQAIFDYNEGASHAAQAIAVISEQVDIASDYNRNLDVLASTGRIDRNQIKIIWQSDPLPNDPIAVRGGLSEEVKQGLQSALVDLSAEEAETLLPPNYTGFVASDGSNYQPIQEAGQLVGKLK